MTKHPFGAAASAAAARPPTRWTDGAELSAERERDASCREDEMEIRVRGGGQAPLWRRTVAAEEEGEDDGGDDGRGGSADGGGDGEMEEVEYEYYDDDGDDDGDDADYCYYYGQDELDDERHDDESHFPSKGLPDRDDANGGNDFLSSSKRPLRPLRVFRSNLSGRDVHRRTVPSASRSVETSSSSPLSVLAALPAAIPSAFVAHLPRDHRGSSLLGVAAVPAFVGVVLLAAVAVRSASIAVAVWGGREGRWWKRFGNGSRGVGDKKKRNEKRWKKRSVVGARGENGNADEPFHENNNDDDDGNSNSNSNNNIQEEEDGSIMDLDADQFEFSSSSSDGTSEYHAETEPTKPKIRILSPAAPMAAFESAWNWVRSQTDRVGSRSRRRPPRRRPIASKPAVRTPLAALSPYAAPSASRDIPIRSFRTKIAVSTPVPMTMTTWTMTTWTTTEKGH
mmetsp:Transcript_23002/g.48708  ORF Transcript_23002/g.48708 Transcript_23002/m.48708 type:complete len:452 (-) Transcript_23002:114-1469(-)